MFRIIRTTSLTILIVCSMSFTSAHAQEMKTEIPPEITTPDSVETSLGTLKFTDGLPDKATVEKVCDNLDRMRGVDVFLNTMSAASTLASITGLKSVGCDNYCAVIQGTAWTR